MKYDDFYDSLTGFFSADIINKYDTTGNTIFGSSYDTLPLSNNFILKDDGAFSTFHTSWPSFDTLFINHFNTSGGLQFTKTYFMDEGALINAAALTADSGYYTVAIHFDLFNAVYKTLLYKFNDLDDTLWTMDVSRHYVNSNPILKSTSDGGCIIIFTTNFYGDSLNYLMKIGAGGEHFPYAIRRSPLHYCIVDTITLSVTGSASYYLWTTGDTTPAINVSQPGIYGVQVIDSLGTVFNLDPVHVNFDTPPYIFIPDQNTCDSYVNLAVSNSPLLTTCWSDGAGYYTNSYHADTILPDTLMMWVQQTTQSGCAAIDSATIIFENCLSIEENAGKSSCIIYPNPTASDFTISNLHGEESELTISDVLGQIKFSKVLNENSDVVIRPELPQGIYFVHVTTNNNTVCEKKILIQK